MAFSLDKDNVTIMPVMLGEADGAKVVNEGDFVTLSLSKENAILNDTETDALESMLAVEYGVNVDDVHTAVTHIISGAIQLDNISDDTLCLSPCLVCIVCLFLVYVMCSFQSVSGVVLVPQTRRCTALRSLHSRGIAAVRLPSAWDWILTCNYKVQFVN
jgi:hypothetical protein